MPAALLYFHTLNLVEKPPYFVIIIAVTLVTVISL